MAKKLVILLVDNCKIAVESVEFGYVSTETR
jgi:hypothetical protein